MCARACQRECGMFAIEVANGRKFAPWKFGTIQWHVHPGTVFVLAVPFQFPFHACVLLYVQVQKEQLDIWVSTMSFVLRGWRSGRCTLGIRVWECCPGGSLQLLHQLWNCLHVSPVHLSGYRLGDTSQCNCWCHLQTRWPAQLENRCNGLDFRRVPSNASSGWVRSLNTFALSVACAWMERHFSACNTFASSSRIGSECAP